MPDVTGAAAGDVTQVEGALPIEQGGGDGIDPKALVKSILEKSVSPDAQLETGARNVPDDQQDEGQQQQVEDDGQQAQQQQAQTQTVDDGGPNVAELEEALLEAGVDLGFRLQDVPKELRGQAEKFVQAAADIVERSLARELEATEATEQLKEFSNQLQQNPDKIMLALAMSSPDAFKKVVALTQEMESDPRVRDMVQRDLATEARYQEVTRKERQLNEASQRQKAGQVIAATRRASRQFGVPFEMAEKVVALAVQANKGNLEVGDVEGIVKDLVPAPAKKPAPRVASPQKVQAQKQAPTGEIGSGAVPNTPASKTTASPGLKETDHNSFMKLIRDTSRRVGGL